MTLFRKISTMLLLAATVGTATAQNGTNSPYSRFGLGLLSDQAQGFNKGMGGVALGLRDGRQVNTLNPASYSALDSLNLVFDVGLSLQNGNFSYNGVKKNARNTSFDYVNIGFRAFKNVGVSVGFMPYSKNGYDFATTSTVGNDPYTGDTRTVVNSYAGEGGLHNLYLGFGWKPFRGFSLGMNAGYLWGNYSHSVSQMYYENGMASSNISRLNRQYTADIQTYKLDFGLQYNFRFNKKNDVTLGATFGLGHSVNNRAHYLNYLAGSDTTTQTVNKAFDLPYTFGAGVAWAYDGRLTLAADYTMQKWVDCKFPTLDGSGKYVSATGTYSNMHKLAVGAEFTPDRMSRRYLKRVHYRVGGYYTTPYLRINGEDGPRELCVSAGLGLPITNLLNNRSVVNMAFQWVNMQSSNSAFPKENYLRLHIGITFNENWFMKWKVN